MARRTPHHAERPQDRRVPLTPQFGEPPPSESPGSRVPPQRDFWERSGQHEPRKAPGSRGAPHRRHLLQPRRSHRLLKAPLTRQGTTSHTPTKAPGAGCLRSAISGSAADSMSRGRYPAHGALPSEGTPLHQRPPLPEPHGIPYKPHGYFPTLRKAGRPRKVSSHALAHEHRPRATGKGGATTRRHPWPIPSSNESGNTPSTRA